MKSVEISNEVEVVDTYATEEYSRKTIDYALKKFKNGKITKDQWNKIFDELNKYKNEEMVSHADSLTNIRFH